LHQELDRQAESSDVFPFELVAVAVTNEPGETETGNVTLNDAFPEASVVTAVKAPRNVCPSPNPEGSHTGLEKNSSVNPLPFLVLLNVPVIVVEPPLDWADAMTG